MRGQLSALAVVLALVLSGCGSDSRDEPSAGITQALASPSSSPAELHDHSPPVGTDEQQDPAAAAAKVLRTWSRPTMDYDQWWADLGPLLNPQGAQDYAETDPAVVPALRLLGSPRVVLSSVPTSAIVWFETTGSTYGRARFGVRLARVSAEAPWLAAEIIFPGATAPARSAA